MVDEATKKTRIYCNWCKQETNHELKGEHEAMFGLEPMEFSESRHYKLWICMGCDRGLLEEQYSNEDMPEGFVTWSYYPERSQGYVFAKPYSKLKPALVGIYKEALTCYNAKALRLCAAGLRALLEGICQDKRVKGKNLKAKIEALQTRLSNKNIIRNLHHFRFMGNEAVHELSAPKATELALAIGVIEDLLNFFYELDYKASQLREIRRNKKPKLTKLRKAVSATLVITPNP